MARRSEASQLRLALAAGLLGLALVGGVIESLRVERRMPAVDLFGNGSKAYINYLLGEQDYQDAIEQLEMQTRMLPLEADNYEQLGNLLGRQGRPEQARAQFLKLVEMRPDYAEGYSLLGATYLDTQQPYEAIPYFARAIELNPRSAAAFNSLGVAVAQIGELEQAAQCFARAVELEPNYEDARKNLDRARKALEDSP